MEKGRTMPQDTLVIIDGDVQDKNRHGLPRMPITLERTVPDGEWTYETDDNGHYTIQRGGIKAVSQLTLIFEKRHGGYVLTDTSAEKQEFYITSEEGDTIAHEGLYVVEISAQPTYYELVSSSEDWKALLDQIMSKLSGLNEDTSGNEHTSRNEDISGQTGFSIDDWLADWETCRDAFIGDPSTDADRWFLEEHIELFQSIAELYEDLDSAPGGNAIGTAADALLGEIMPRLRILFEVAESRARESMLPQGSNQNYAIRRDRLEAAIEFAECILNEVRPTGVSA